MIHVEEKESKNCISYKLSANIKYLMIISNGIIYVVGNKKKIVTQEFFAE